MRTILSIFATFIVLLLVPDAVNAQAQTSAGVVRVSPEDIEWQKTEGGYHMAVLYGDPSGEGHYLIRFKLPPNWTGRPHTHPGAEIVTIYSGTLLFAYGEDLSRDAAKEFAPGSIVALPGGTKMRAFTGSEEVILDAQGQGPFAIQYLDE